MIAPLQSMLEPTSDPELMAAYRSGDQAAFETLYQRYNASVTGYAARMLGRREEAEDVCTEAFVRILDGRWRPQGSFRGFLFTVVHRLCVDRIRRRKRRAKILAVFGLGEVAGRNVEEALVLGERDAALQRAVARLPEAHRAAILLTYTEGLTSPEVGAVLGCTDQQVRSKLAYARRLLRQDLEANDGA